MKKKFLSFLLIALVCCSAMVMFAGCEGDPMSNITASVTGGPLTFNVQNYNDIYNKTIKEQVKLATNLSSITLKLEGAKFAKSTANVGLSNIEIDLLADANSGDAGTSTGDSTIALSAAIDKPDCTVSGLKDLTTPGNGVLTVTYQNYIFYVSYEVKAA